MVLLNYELDRSILDFVYKCSLLSKTKTFIMTLYNIPPEHLFVLGSICFGQLLPADDDIIIELT